MLAKFVRDRVSRVELQRRGVTTVLVRRPQARRPTRRRWLAVEPPKPRPIAKKSMVCWPRSVGQTKRSLVPMRRKSAIRPRRRAASAMGWRHAASLGLPASTGEAHVKGRARRSAWWWRPVEVLDKRRELRQEPARRVDGVHAEHWRWSAATGPRPSSRTPGSCGSKAHFGRWRVCGNSPAWSTR